MTAYMIDTNADADRLALDGDRETATAWFEESLPGDEIADYREALITAAVRLAGEDREFLASSGYKIVED
nr:MAG TPA: hypothetical protein [Caudoviricetes sp.]